MILKCLDLAELLSSPNTRKCLRLLVVSLVLINKVGIRCIAVLIYRFELVCSPATRLHSSYTGFDQIETVRGRAFIYTITYRGVATSMIARLKQLRNDFFSSVTTFRV